MTTAGVSPVAVEVDAPAPGDDEVRPEQLPLEEVEARLCRLAGQIAAATCRWLDLVATFDEREGYAPWGMVSTAQWLTWRCGLSLGTAREHVRVARALQRLATLRAAFAAGRLSYSQVRAISRVAESLPQLEADLVELAKDCSAAQLEHICRGLRRADQAPPSRARRYLRHHYDEDGYLIIHARLTPEEGAVVLAALRTAQDQASVEAPEDQPDPASHSDTPPEADGDRSETAIDDPGQVAADEDDDDPEASTPAERSAVDALLALAERFLTGPSDGSRVEPQVILYLDLPALTGDSPGGMARLDDGLALHPDTARRLCCTAGIVPMLVNGPFEVLNLGRATRVPNTAQRRALHRRDQGRCRFPGCHRRRGVEAHHIIFWSQGGPTDLDNLILLCKRHHIYVHEGGYRITADGPVTFTFYRPDGTQIPAPGLPDPGNAQSTLDLDLDLDLDEQTARQITPDTLPSDPPADHRRPDPSYVIDGLLHTAHHRANAEREGGPGSANAAA